MLIVAVQEGMPRAQEAFDYLDPFLSLGRPSQLADKAGWAIALSDDVVRDNTRPEPPRNVRRIR